MDGSSLVSAAVIDQMEQSLRRVASLVRRNLHVKHPGRFSEEDQARAIHEMAMRREVLAHIAFGGLTGEAAIWGEYMLYHAELEIARERGEIGQDEFLRLAIGALNRRDELCGLAIV